jgi:ATP-dependent Clp protease ATP-binding subunit ClpA
VLLDEIEKAHPDIYNILLQVMDHARPHRQHRAQGRLPERGADPHVERRLTRAERADRSASPTAAPARSTTSRCARPAAVRSKPAIERVFSPEFRNRLDAIVTFRPLSATVMEEIVEKFVLQLEQQLAERRVAITLTPEARAWLAVKGYDPVFGARPLARVVQTEVRDPLTDQILFGALENGGTVTIGVADNALTFTYEGREIQP